MSRKDLQRLMGEGDAARRDAAGAAGAQRTGPRSRQGRDSTPPLTGVESPPAHAGAKVDWCTVTWLPEPDEYVQGGVMDLLKDVLGQVTAVEVPGMFGYERGLKFFVVLDDGQQHHLARLDWGGNHHQARARLDLSGSACSKVNDWRKLSDWIGSQWDYKLTRVDLAVDCLNGEYTVEHARDWYMAGDFNAGGRMPRHSTPGDWLAPHHGRTLEVGRRTNGKMLRAYEKGRQLGDPESLWTRFEVELRNIDRDLPLDVLTECDTYFAGAYKALQRVLPVAATRISTHQKEGELSLGRLVYFARQGYGKVTHVLRGHLDADELLDFISRPGVPKRLEKASLAGFSVAASPSAFLREETSHESPSRGF